MSYRDADILRIKNIIQQLDVYRCKQIAGWLAEYIKHLEADEALFGTSIQQLQLSSRSLHVLQANGISTIGELVRQSIRCMFRPDSYREGQLCNEC